jgi:SAM-dependent methyltransferase
MRRWIAEFLRGKYPDGARVLCYGDGLGYDSLYLAQAGHDVTYFEVSDRCRQFASAIFQRAGTPVRSLDSPTALEQESFDAVVCLDVLEHVPDPSLLVGELARRIRGGGYLLVHAPFYYVAPPVATHLHSNRRYSGDLRLYAAHDLFPVAGELFWNPLALRKTARSARAAIPPAIRLGGCLLCVARFWHAPHVFVCERLMARADRRELLRRAEMLAVLPLPDGTVDSPDSRDSPAAGGRNAAE